MKERVYYCGVNILVYGTRSVSTTFKDIVSEQHVECVYYCGVNILVYGTRSVPTTFKSDRTMFKLFDPNSDFNITAGSNLPHWFQPQATYFITFRTADSIPVPVMRRFYAERSEWLALHGIAASMPNWKNKLEELPDRLRIHFHQTFSIQYLKNLDKSFGACVLKQPKLSKIVADSLLYFNGDRYHIGDFVVMPNHVHLLVCLLGNTDLLKQCHSWKKFSAVKINKVLGRVGRFWQEESFDNLVRSHEQFFAIQEYIRKNPSHLQDGEYFLYQI